MGKSANIEKSGSATISQNLETSFDTWESDAFNLSGNNEEGIITLQVNCSSAATATIGIKQSVDGTNFDVVDDSNQANIVIALNTTTTILNVINIHSSFIKVYGVSGGTGTLETIDVIVK